MTPTPGPIKKLWFQWKMLRLPWRKKWLVGFDLKGNTYWEFKDQLHALRSRRIMKPSVWTHHGDVKVPPQWSQWLKFTRFEPPTVSELQSDVIRQQRIKVLAAQADARWAAKESALDAPNLQQPVHMLESRDPRSGMTQSGAPPREAVGLQGEGESYPTLRGGVVAPSDQAAVQTPGKAEEKTAAPTEEKADENAPTLKKRKVMKREPKDSPWKKAQSNPGQEFQPQQWTPGPAKRK